jgi:hypothetical protein
MLRPRIDTLEEPVRGIEDSSNRRRLRSCVGQRIVSAILSAPPERIQLN